MTVYGQGVRSAAADMFERGLGRDAVACALGIPSCAVRKWHETFRAVGREVLLDMGKARSYDWETKVAAASAVVDSGRAKPEVMREFGIASKSPLDSWCRKYRECGAEALRPKPKGRPNVYCQALADKIGVMISTLSAFRVPTSFSIPEIYQA